MIKEAKNIDFSTTGRRPSEEDFARISEWIMKDKKKQKLSKSKNKLAVVQIDKSLNKYSDVVLFPEKVEKAKQAFDKLGLPKVKKQAH